MVYDEGLLQSYTNGSVSAPVGSSNGLLQTALIPFIKGTEITDEVLDSADGIKVSFSGTLAHYPVGLRRLIVKYTISTNDYEAKDDGSGLIQGTYCSGLIDHKTGDFSLDFDVGFAPDNGTDITADYLYGDPGRDWRIIIERNTQNTSGDDEDYSPHTCKEYVLHNTGISGQEDVYIGIREWCYVAGGAYGWDLNAYTTKVVSSNHWNDNRVQHNRTSYSTTWKHYTQHPMLPLADGNIAYWIQSNQQCIKVEVRLASGRYECMYLGFMKRYGTKEEYPFPLFIKGALFGDLLYSSNSSYHSPIVRHYESIGGGNYSAWIVGPGNNYVLESSSKNAIAILPRNSFNLISGTLVGPTETALRYPAKPVVVKQVFPTEEAQILGELDGVDFIFGSPLLAEDVIKHDTKECIAFPDPVLATWYDFFSVDIKTLTTTTT